MYQGIIIGFFAFLLIGLFHPVVVKLEYYFGKRCWIAVALCGIPFLIWSFFLPEWKSIVCGIVAFTLFWTAVEVVAQHRRVIKGRAKMNPKRNYSSIKKNPTA